MPHVTAPCLMACVACGWCSYLAVVAVAELPDPTAPPKVVGFAAFSDSPCGAELGEKVEADTWVSWLKGAFGMNDVEVLLAPVVSVALPPPDHYPSWFPL